MLIRCRGATVVYMLIRSLIRSFVGLWEREIVLLQKFLKIIPVPYKTDVVVDVHDVDVDFTFFFFQIEEMK